WRPHSSAAMKTQDFHGGILGRKVSDVQALVMGRWITLSLIVFGAVTAPLTMMFSGVYTAIQSILAVIQGPTIALLFVGMFWRRATAEAGFLGSVAGFFTSISLTVLHKVMQANSPT